MQEPQDLGDGHTSSLCDFSACLKVLQQDVGR
jgi:hypothetical protein